MVFQKVHLKVGIKKYNTVCGTPEYFAPEILKNAPYGKSVDFWNFGCLIFELFTGHSPFYTHEIDEKKLFSKILHGEYVIPEYVPEDASDLITKLLIVDPKTRLGNSGVDQIKAHLFFKSISWTEILKNHKKGPISVKYEKEEMKLRALNINFDENIGHEDTFELLDFSFTEGYKSDELVAIAGSQPTK